MGETSKAEVAEALPLWVNFASDLSGSLLGLGFPRQGWLPKLRWLVRLLSPRSPEASLAKAKVPRRSSRMHTCIPA